MAPPTIKMESKPTLLGGAASNTVDLTADNTIDQELTNEYEFVGNVDYLRAKTKFGEEVLGRRCLVLFDTKPETKPYKPKSGAYKGQRKRKKGGRPKQKRKGTVPASGRVVGFKKQMVDETQFDIEKIEFEVAHLIRFDEKQENDNEEETEWWMDLNDLRDRGELFWEDHVVQRVAVKRRKKKKAVAEAKAEPQPEGTEGNNATTPPEGEKKTQQQPELPPELAELVANPKWPIGSEVWWHLMQPTKPGQNLNPNPDPTGRLTQLPQPSGLDLSGFVEETPNQENDYRYKVSLPGEFQASILLHPNAILKGKKKRKERKSSSGNRPPKRPKIPTLPWIESMAEWMISVPTAKTEKAKARVMTRQSAQVVVQKAKLLAAGKGIAYGPWTANAAGDDEHSKNLTIFYKDQCLNNLQEFDYETARSDGAAHELLYGKDHSNGWLYSYALTKIHQFQQYCIHHDLDMENPPQTWQELPGSQEPLPETQKSPRKKKENGTTATAKATPKKTMEDPLEGLSDMAREYLASIQITTAEQFLSAQTKDVAEAYPPWRERKGMDALKGDGQYPTVSGWKARVRKVAAQMEADKTTGEAPGGEAAGAATANADPNSSVDVVVTDRIAVAGSARATVVNTAKDVMAARKNIQSSPLQPKRKKQPSPSQQQQQLNQPRGKQLRLPIQRTNQPQQQQIHQQQQQHQQLLFEAAASLMEQQHQQQLTQQHQYNQYPQQQYNQPPSQQFTYGQQQQQPGYPYNHHQR